MDFDLSCGINGSKTLNSTDLNYSIIKMFKSELDDLINKPS